MTPSRLVRVFFVTLLLCVVPSFASAATTEFRVLFDVDNDDETGCSVNGMDGVDQVLVTQVTEGDASTTRVARTHRQSCVGTVLGAATDIDTTGWASGWNATNKLLTIETRIPFSAFGSEDMPSDIHAGFDASRNGSVHTSLANQNGTPIVIPEPPTRRRAIGTGAARHITMDGNLADWGDITPAVVGLASNGSSTLRLLRILAWPDPNDEHVYFAATAYLGSDHPYADDNTYLRQAGQNLSVSLPGVLGNDGIPGGAPLTAQKVSDPKRGTVTLNADGSFTYSPTHPQLIADDEFEYKAVGGGKESNVARVLIQIDQNETPPCDTDHPNAPCPDSYETPEDTIKVVPAPTGVLANDPHGDQLVASLHTAPTNGTVVLNADGGFTYTPNANFSGVDTFVYTATKLPGAPPGIGGNATVTITVTEVPDDNAPVAGEDGPYSVDEDGTLNVAAPGLLANDADADGDAITAELVTGAAHGNVTVNPNGSFVYEPSADYFGPDSFQYHATDGTNDSNVVTVNLTVNPINDAPSFTSGPDPVTVAEDSGPYSATWATAISAGPGEPQAVAFTVTNGNNALFSVQPSISPTGTLTFTPAADAHGSALVSVTLTDSGSNVPPNANSFGPVTFTITVGSVNDAPTFTLAGNQTVNEDAGPQTVNSFATGISPGPADEAGQTVTFNVTNNNNALFSAQPSISPAGVLTYTPATNVSGSATVSVTATDSGGATSAPPQTFTITVNAVNDQPTFAVAGNPPASTEDAGPQTVNGFASSINAGAPDESGQTLTFTLTPTGTTGDLTFATGPSIDASGTLTYTASANTNGTATFNVVLTDSGSNVPPNDNTSPTLSFTITVVSVNDAPTFTLAGDQTINEDAGPQTVNGFASSISVGPANESGQTITSFNVTNDNNALFLQQPAIDNAGNLTYQANANMSGMATVSVTATDSGGATSAPPQTFVITVNGVNDAPTFAILADPPASNEDAGPQTVNNFASSISAGPADESGQALSFTVTPTGTTGDLAFATGPSIDASGTLTYTASANTNGTASFNVVLTDSGSNVAPNDNTSATLSFTITVTSVNDPPTFTLGGNQSVGEDAGPQTVNNFASSISVGPANESGQTITSFNVTNDNNALFFAQPAIDNAGNLTYQVNANASGSALVSVTATDSGGATSSPAQTFIITVNAVNDNPVVTAGATLNYTENQGPTAIDTTITVSDVDSPMLTGATVTISNNFASGEDVLSFSNIGAITIVSYTGGVLTLTGTDTVANYQAALRTVAYSNTSENPSTAARTITWQVNDGAGVNNLSVPVTSTVNVASANDAPTVNAVATLGYTEGNGAVAIDPALTLSDPDDTQMSGATVAITANYAGEDILSFTPVGSITGIFAAGTLTLSGTDTIANYQAALRSVTYNNTSSNPSIAPRTITWTVNDMAPAPGTDTTTINITPINSKPTMSSSALTPTIFTEDGAPVQVDATLTLTDADTANLVGATVTISANYVQGEDFLQFVDTLNITGVFNGITGTLTLTGTDTVVAYQTALRNVTYENISDNPSTAQRTITWVVDDGEPVDNLSTPLLTALDVAAVNDPPTVNADDLNYTEDAGAVVIDSSVSVNDPDDANLTGATVQITTNCTPGEDVLGFTNAFGVSFVSYTPATCTLVLTGSVSQGAYASALSTVTYQNTSNHPSTAARSVTWTVSDDQPSSGSDVTTINVSRLNDPPTAVDDIGATDENTVLNVPATGVLTNDTDPDSGDTKTVVAVNGVGGNVGAAVTTGKGATVTLNANGSYSYDPTGSATLQALATGATDTDTFTYTMQDTAGAQSTATVTITITGVNDAPTVAADNLLYTENDGAVVIDGSVSVVDVDDATLTGATVVITGNCTPGEDVLNFSDAFGVTFVSYTPATCTLVLTGTTSAANYASALSTVTYQNTSEHPSIAQRTITWTVSDDEPSSGNDTSTIDVSRLNDPPVAVDDTNSTTEDASVNAVAPGVLTNDTDNDSGDTKTVVAVNGGGGNVGVATATTQGGSVTLNADGSYTYNPTGSATLQALPAGATLNDTFTYTMQDGAASQATATVTITVTGVNDAPAGTNNTVTIDEDATYTFAVADFGFTDPIDNPDDAFTAVTITTLPGTGSLTLSGNPVVAGQSIPVANIPNLVFTPVANGSGSPYASFTFQVQDNGGTANGGVDLDPSANTMTINVNNVNDAPAGTDATVATFEDTQHTFTVANFGFTDPVDLVPNTLQSVLITTLPAAGSLTLSGNPVIAGQEIAVADITAGNLKFLAAANASGTPYTTFTFQVRDNGGTANGGVDLDPTPNTITINVTAVNDAPAGTDATVTTDEDVQYTFTAANFGFTDPNDAPPNALSSVVITTIPAAGSLTLSGNPVSAGQEIPVASITAGNLRFLSALNAFGSPYTAFTFQVRDDGGTANGGVNLDPTPNTMTINVNPVNDGPTVVNETFDVLGNTELRVDMVPGSTPHALETTAGASAYEGALDNDSDVENDPIAITGIVGCTVADPTPPFDCTLASGAVVHVDANGEFSFTPAPGATSGSFTYTVTDTPAFGTPISVNGTVTFTHQQMIWYVRQGASGNGTSIAPFGNFDSLDGAGGGGDLDDADDYIFVHHTGTPLVVTQTVPLEAGQRVLGEDVGLSIPVALNGNASPTVLVANGPSRPALTLAAGDLFTIINAIPVEIRGLHLTAGGGNVVGLDSNGALTGSPSLLISENTVGGAGAEGIDIAMNAGTTGTLALSITSNDWNGAGTHSGNAIDVVRAAGTLHLNISNNTNILSTGSAGISVNGAITITGFSGNSVHGNTGGTGITVTGATFDATAGAPFNTVSGGNTSVGASGNGVGGSGVVLTNVAGDLSFTNLNIYASAGTGLGATGMAAPFNAATATGFRLVNLGSDTIEAAGGPAVNIGTATITLTPAVAKSTGTTTFGVNLDNVAGTFTAGSSSEISGLASAAATAYRINGSSVNATWQGIINITQGAGVSLTTNTGTHSFTNTLTLSTGASAAFTATTSGTVSTTDNNSTITTTTGGALNVSNTNIALVGIKFKSITAGTAASGPAFGIVLNNTGTTAAFGGLTILGGASAGNGGTIQRCGTGISLTSTRGVVLNDLLMSNFTDWAIRGSSVVNFTLDNTTINGTNGDNDATNDGSIYFTELTGSASITNSAVSGGHEDNIVVLNTTGTLDRITLNTVNVGANGNAFGDNGVLFEASGTAVLKATVTSCTFTSSRGDHIQFNAAGGSPTGDFVLTNSAFSNSHPSTVSGAGGIRVTTGASGSTPNVIYNIANNVINGARGTAIGTTEGIGAGILSGTIDNNDIGSAGVANSGSLEGHGISVVMADLGAHYVNITNNDVRQYNLNGIFVQAGGGASASSGDLKAVVTGNAVGNFGNNGAVAPPAGRNGFQLNSGTFPGDTFRVCLDFGGAGALENSIVGSGDGVGSGTDFRLRHRQDTTVYLNGYAGGSTNDAAVTTYIQNRNAGTPSGTVTNSGTGGGWSTGYCPF